MTSLCSEVCLKSSKRNQVYWKIFWVDLCLCHAVITRQSSDIDSIPNVCVCAKVYLKNLPPNSSLIEEIMDRVKGFLVSKALLKGDPSITSRPLSHLRGERVSVSPPHLNLSFSFRCIFPYVRDILLLLAQKTSDSNLLVWDDVHRIALPSPIMSCYCYRHPCLHMLWSPYIIRSHITYCISLPTWVYPFIHVK